MSCRLWMYGDCIDYLLMATILWLPVVDPVFWDHPIEWSYFCDWQSKRDHWVQLSFPNRQGEAQEGRLPLVFAVQDTETFGSSFAWPWPFLPAMRPSAEVCQCLDVATLFAACCGPRSKHVHEDPVSFPIQVAKAVVFPRWWTWRQCCNKYFLTTWSSW